MHDPSRAKASAAHRCRRFGLPLLCAIGLAAAAQFTAAQTAAPTGRLLARAGTELVARADGPACGARVKVVITSTDPKLFEGEIPPAARFFTNARAGHSLSCPQMTRMVAQGQNNGRIMFTAMADRSNGWEALMLGATANEDTAVASGGPTPKSVLRSSPTFVQAGTVLAETKDKYLCLAGATLACDVIVKFTPQDGERVTVAYRQALSGGRAAAAMTSTATMRDSFFCADPETMAVVVEDAQMNEDARKDYAEQLLERMKSNGEACTGFTGRIDAMTAYVFDPSGKGLDRARAVRLSSTMPSFTGGR